MLYTARWVVIAGVLVEAELEFTTARVQRTQVLISAVAVAVLTAVVGLAAARLRRLQNPLLLVLADIGMVTAIVYFSDGIQSPFFPLYYVTLIEAAASFGTLGALTCAAAIGVVSAGIEVTDATRIMTRARLLEDFLKTVPYLFLITAITGPLCDRIRTLADAAATLRAKHEANEREMMLAREVQMAQLVTSVPVEPGVDIEVIYEPAREIGGDLYDFYPVLPDRLGVVVADVSGKGVPAALLVSTAKYAVRHCYAEDKAAMTKALNEHFLSTTLESSFITMIHGVIDMAVGEFRYVNAGHMPPILIDGSTGETCVHRGADVPVGVSASAVYSERRVPLRPGDTLVLYTDGVTDALDSTGDGVAAFERLLAQVGPNVLPHLRDALAAVISEPSRVDDITVVAIRIKPNRQ
ncbi:MAG: PP2C family protein-serine/threonine phosphatase [Armatimonadota bacterium]